MKSFVNIYTWKQNVRWKSKQNAILIIRFAYIYFKRKLRCRSLNSVLYIWIVHLHLSIWELLSVHIILINISNNNEYVFVQWFERISYFFETSKAIFFVHLWQFFFSYSWSPLNGSVETRNKQTNKKKTLKITCIAPLSTTKAWWKMAFWTEL